MVERGEERDDVGAEGGDDENAETLPFAPGEGDDTPLGDTDQHSAVPSDGPDAAYGPRPAYAA